MTAERRGFEGGAPEYHFFRGEPLHFFLDAYPSIIHLIRNRVELHMLHVANMMFIVMSVD